MLRSSRLDLVPATLAHFDALGTSESNLAAQLGVTAAPDWLDFEAAREALAQMAQSLPADYEPSTWCTYWFVHRADAALIGLGGYKGAPTDGAVEIGYTLAPGYRRQGLATEAARAMVERAFVEPEVDRVLAHTLPEVNASTAVLSRLGFGQTETVEDPEDGTIWQWVLGRAPMERPGT